MKKTVLIQGAGGGGGNNLIRSLRQSSLDLKILGSNCLPHAVAKSTADSSFLLSECSDDLYEEQLVELIKAEHIDLVIPNNDREVAAVSSIRDSLPCRYILPPKETVRVCQDKNLFYAFLSDVGMDTVPSSSIESYEKIDEAFAKLPKCDRYWVRPKTGSGSKGATWVRTPEQAKMWISLWHDLRGVVPSEFQISCFLPGKDYNFHSVWNNGRLVVAKVCERLSYFMGANRLSGMSSTPEIARTLSDQVAADMIVNVIKKLPGGPPNGNYNVDLKGDADGNMFITEINIGRFPMITTLHDSVGRVNSAEAYVRCGLGERVDYGNPFDFTDGHMLLRDLDTEPLVIHEKDLLDR